MQVCDKTLSRIFVNNSIRKLLFDPHALCFYCWSFREKKNSLIVTVLNINSIEYIMQKWNIFPFSMGFVLFLKQIFTDFEVCILAAHALWNSVAGLVSCRPKISTLPQTHTHTTDVVKSWGCARLPSSPSFKCQITRYTHLTKHDCWFLQWFGMQCPYQLLSKLFCFPTFCLKKSPKIFSICCQTKTNIPIFFPYSSSLW